MHTSRDQSKHIGRLLKRADFLRVQSSGKKWVTPHLIIQMAPMVTSEKDPGLRRDDAAFSCRVGLTVPKKIFKSAVDRNRMRRRLRALMTDALVARPPTTPTDFVVLPRQPALTASHDILEKDIAWALKRLQP